MSTPFSKNPGDIPCAAAAAVLLLAPLLSDTVLNAYITFTVSHPFSSGFVKFALLSTFGEALAQRALRGQYLPAGFGLVPRAVIWGLLGLCITMAFTVFSAGVPQLLAQAGLEWAPGALAGSLGLHKLLTAFAVSVAMNVMFAPALMVAHKIGDLHLAAYNGSLSCLVHGPRVGELLASVNWQVMWRVVLVRSLLFFWIPVHTVTFLLPSAFRVLFAAFLGACLGLILAWAGSRGRA